MSRVIGILSGKGGVGKTTLTANLGAALSKLDCKPLLIDTNVKASSLGFHLGFYEELPVTLNEILEEGTPLTHGIFIHPSLDLKFMPAPIHGRDTKLDKLDDLISSLKKKYEVILLDIAPAFSEEAIKSIESLDEAIVITTPSIPAVADTMRTISYLEDTNKKILGIVLNKVNEEVFEVEVNEIEDKCGFDVIGAIPTDKKVRKSVEFGVPVVQNKPFSKSSISMMKLASELLDIEWEPPGLLKRLTRFFRSENEYFGANNLSGLDNDDITAEVGGSDKYRCKKCGKSFSSKRGLSIHKSKVH